MILSLCNHNWGCTWSYIGNDQFILYTPPPYLGVWSAISVVPIRKFMDDIDMTFSYYTFLHIPWNMIVNQCNCVCGCTCEYWPWVVYFVHPSTLFGNMLLKWCIWLISTNASLYHAFFQNTSKYYPQTVVIMIEDVSGRYRPWPVHDVHFTILLPNMILNWSHCS